MGKQTKVNAVAVDDGNVKSRSLRCFSDDYDRTVLCELPFTSLVVVTQDLNCIYKVIYFDKF